VTERLGGTWCPARVNPPQLGRDFCTSSILGIGCSAFGFSSLLPLSCAGTVKNRGNRQLSLIEALFCINNSSIMIPKRKRFEVAGLYHICVYLPS